MRAVLLPVLLLCAAPALSQDIAFAGVLPNGGLFHSPVTSMQGQRFAHLVRQRTDYSCGAASLATLLRYGYGLDANEDTVIEGMLGLADPELVAERGFSLLDIKHYVESLGMRGRGYRINEARLRSLRVPALALMDVAGFRHFVVLKQVHGDTVEVGDPILGNRSLPVHEFMAAWPSRAVFVVVGSGFDRNTVLLQPGSARPSARSLMARQGVRPLSEGELLDFGFSHADLF